ncbi:hypothetical protein [Thalassolituus alkanivorans]|uniref:hypothetical protein n=1 Tax=Thalassolituus alkanivorans TaxID=2881055 RepID=UPI001E303527|nr:hypothetical protein [Thalassolituus alkanivorans]MCB2385491.1 hypothetical protein [Thalassolituus alkanivorans]MCB2423253.1 hypothetical protein [Thalassolituus alkanivorans]
MNAAVLFCNWPAGDLLLFSQQSKQCVLFTLIRKRIVFSAFLRDTDVPKDAPKDAPKDVRKKCGKTLGNANSIIENVVITGWVIRSW